MTLKVILAYYSSTLSPGAKKALVALSKKLVAGASVTVTGYAQDDVPLANSRATAVSRYLSSLVKIHVTLRTVTNVGVREVIVRGTKK